jgi:hypothetical protein
MKKIALATLTALCTTVAVYAQGGPGGPPPGPGPGFRGGFPGPGGPGPGMHPWKVVTGAPYSASFTEQSVRVLANGSTITRSVTGAVARDSSGRAYIQQTFTGGPFGQNGPKTVVFITDPVAGQGYTLYPDKMEADQRPFRTPPEGAANRPPRNPASQTNPNVSVSKATGGTYQNLANIETTTTTRTIPANTMGNSATLTSTSVVQYSPDLQIVVSSTRSDPEIGHSTYTLSNIVQGEPNVSFTVPSGYAIKTAPVMRRRHEGPGAPPQE